jgi:hypothetical protein
MPDLEPVELVDAEVLDDGAEPDDRDYDDAEIVDDATPAGPPVPGPPARAWWNAGGGSGSGGGSANAGGGGGWGVPAPRPSSPPPPLAGYWPPPPPPGYWPLAPAGPINVVVTMQPARQPLLSWSRLHPLWNLTAGLAGLVLVPETNKLLHIAGDQPGVIYTAALSVLVAEAAAMMKRRRSGWLVRAATWHVALLAVLTPAGLHALSLPFTGV